MNNAAFKTFLGPYLTQAIEDLGGLAKVRGQHAQMAMTSFVSGYIVGMISREQRGVLAMWRDEDVLAKSAGLGQLTQEEIRRVFDLVRLHLETESTTS